MESETIYTKEELQEAVELVTNAKNTDDLPAYSWARIANILSEELKKYTDQDLYCRVEPEEGQLVQYLAVYALDWPWSVIEPTDAFIEVEE